MKAIKFAAAFFIVGSVSGIADANATTLISADLAAASDGLLTVDSNTSLEWLDLTATVGLSRADVAASSFVAEGFRYATQDEVLQLWQDAGANVSTASYTESVADYAPANELLSLMGCTSSRVYYAVGCSVRNGFSSQDYWNLGYFGAGARDVAFVGYDIGNPFYDVDAGNGLFYLGYGGEPESNVNITTRNDIGSYLVRVVPVSAVPEPDVWVMMILGFGLVGSLLRHDRKLKTNVAVASLI